MLSAQPAVLKSLTWGLTRVAPAPRSTRNGRIGRTQLARCAHRPAAREGKLRAVVGKEETHTEPKPSGGSDVLPSGQIEVRAVMTIRKNMNDIAVDSLQEEWQSFINGLGLGIDVQLISEEIDPETKEGKKSVKKTVRGWLPKESSDPQIDEFTANFTVPSDFGRPGAVIVTNLQDKEFFLLQVVVLGFASGPFNFPANSWIHPRSYSKEGRVIFGTLACLPSKTPESLKDLRQKELIKLRGDGKGERKIYDRIYDFDLYNDLGNPDEDIDLARPTLGGEKIPYPRRCRTGRPPTESDPTAESKIENSVPVYVPRDEKFEEVKQATFSAGRLKALLHNLIPQVTATFSNSNNQFKSFSDIDDLFIKGVALCKDPGSGLLLPTLIKKIFNVKDQLLKYEFPSIVSRDRFSWLRDNEFARQTLAGLNPSNIERLREFPITSKLDPAVYGSPESAITREILESEMDGMSVEEAIEQHRLFILDFHDMLLPFVNKVNSLEDRKIYASRTIFFHNKAGSLVPIAIELSLPPTPSTPQKKKVYTEGHYATPNWKWRWAKAHVCANDAGVHQLVNHWLRTHACMEVYIIAANRQLSSMHPVFKLLHPHMRYTLEINALARQSLISGGGVIEECFGPGKYSMELCAAAYDSTWRFDMEGLPADLLRRGMAVEDPSMPCGVKLVIEDYPYAADGLLIWSAMKEWVHDYINHYYPNSESIVSDEELQGWWDEVKNKGHYDKRNAPWWPSLKTVEDLEGILTTIIWIASAQHAALNFGQFPIGGYMPNRPTVMKKLIPDEEDDHEHEKFLRHPQYMFLSALPSQQQTSKIVAVQHTLSTHAPDEEYLGQMHDMLMHWVHNNEILSMYKKFTAKLEDAEVVINQRNKDKRLINRNAAGIPPYELLLPTSTPGVTGRGVPNSVSI